MHEKYHFKVYPKLYIHKTISRNPNDRKSNGNPRNNSNLFAWIRRPVAINPAEFSCLRFN
eukprot:Gb_27783 [translate_table: standard]